MASSDVASRRKTLDVYDPPAKAPATPAIAAGLVSTNAVQDSAKNANEAVDDLILPLVSTVRQSLWNASAVLKREYASVAAKIRPQPKAIQAETEAATNTLRATWDANRHIVIGSGASIAAGAAVSAFAFPKRPIFRRLVAIPGAMLAAFAYLCPDESKQAGGYVKDTLAGVDYAGAYRNLTKSIQQAGPSGSSSSTTQQQAASTAPPAASTSEPQSPAQPQQAQQTAAATTTPTQAAPAPTGAEVLEKAIKSQLTAKPKTKDGPATVEADYGQSHPDDRDAYTTRK